MGNKVVTFTEDQFNAYQDCTYFTKKDILRIFQRFHKLNPNVIPVEMSEVIASTLKVSTCFLEEMPEFKANPFNKRIFRVFSSDGSSHLTFNEFLDMFSVFSDAAPRELKISYAFKIYDFDEDKELGRNDLHKTLRCLSRNELTEEEMSFVVNKVLEEGDLDDKGSLSYMEFEHIISRDPDFLSMFHIRI
ncbi:CIB2 [Acanthosepion pharaonis]|uniref:CIB2 n=1 Tax=Acanthosepion pharaonis TaxID=158019 RepID=A0A812ATD6_ACAPH|nr:CIB2 [Sepia pharaonis]